MNRPRFSLKQGLKAAGLLAIIAVCWGWIYLSQRAVPLDNVPLHQGVGQVLAEETAKCLGQRGQIVLVALSPREFPELKIQLDAFENTLRRTSAISIQQKIWVEANDPKYGVGRGLSAKKLFQIVKKHPTADAIVSFIGAPNFTDAEAEEMAKARPKFVAETHSAERTLKLLEKRALHAAIISRFSPPGPSSKHPRTARDWFDRYFQVVTSAASPDQAAATP